MGAVPGAEDDDDDGRRTEVTVGEVCERTDPGGVGRGFGCAVDPGDVRLVLPSIGGESEGGVGAAGGRARVVEDDEVDIEVAVDSGMSVEGFV